MPKVPVYGEPQVRQQGLPNARMTAQNVDGATADAFGAGAGRTAGMLAKATDSIGKEFERQQEVKDATSVFESKNKFRLGLQNIEAEVAKRQGTNAAGAKEWASGELKKLQDEIGSGLTTDRQRRLFAQESESIGISALGAFGEHEARQIERGHDDNWKATKELAIDEAMRNPSPENMARVEAEIQKANKYQAARKGWDEKVLAAETLGDMSKMHTGILRKIMAGGDQNLGAASAYLKAHGDKIDPVIAADLQDKIQVKAEAAAAVSYARGAMEGGKTMGQAITDARAELGTGKAGDRAVSEIRQAYAERELIKNDAINTQIDVINAEIVKNGGVHRLTDEALAPMKTLDPARYEDIKNKRENAKVNIAENGQPYAQTTNLDTRDFLKEMIENGDLKERRAMDLYIPDLTRSDYLALSKLIDNRDKIIPGAIKKEYVSIIGSSKLTDAQREEMNYVDSKYADWIDKEKNPNDIRKFVADSMAEYRRANQGTVNRWINGPVQPEYDVLAEDDVERASLRDQGLTVTSDEDLRKTSQAAKAIIETMPEEDKAKMGLFKTGGDAALLYKEAVQGLVTSKTPLTEGNIRWAMLQLVQEKKANGD